MLRLNKAARSRGPPDRIVSALDRRFVCATGAKVKEISNLS
jgi:hypothetical protein